MGLCHVPRTVARSIYCEVVGARIPFQDGLLSGPTLYYVPYQNKVVWSTFEWLAWREEWERLTFALDQISVQLYLQKGQVDMNNCFCAVPFSRRKEISFGHAWGLGGSMSSLPITILSSISQVPSVKETRFGKQLTICVSTIPRTSVKLFSKDLCLIPFSATPVTDFFQLKLRRVLGLKHLRSSSRRAALCVSSLAAEQTST